MRERRTIELAAIDSPLRHSSIHQCDKAVVMVPFEQVDHLVCKHEGKAGWRLLGKLEIEPYATRLGIARPPQRLHPLDAQLPNRHPDLRLPLLSERRQPSLKLAAVPPV